ncbi:uncharacterized protein LOC144444458 [Glandiceps talaboti]
MYSHPEEIATEINISGGNCMVGENNNLFDLKNCSVHIHTSNECTGISRVVSTAPRTANKCKSKGTQGDSDSSGSTRTNMSKTFSRRRRPYNHTEVPEQILTTKRTKAVKGHEYVRLVKILLDIQQSGQWTQVDIQCDRLMEECDRCDSTDHQIIILIYKSTAKCLQLETEKAMNLVEKAETLLPQSENRQLLQAKILIQKGYIHRKQKLLGKAQSCLETALQILLNIEPCAFRGECKYKLAGIKYELSSRQAKPEIEDSLMKKIIGDILTANDLMFADDPKATHYLRQISKMKMVGIYLDCDSSAGRSRPKVAENRIKKAADLLQNIQSHPETEYGGFSDYTTIYLAEGRACYYYRCRDFVQAEKLADEALALAKQNGFTAKSRSTQNLLKDFKLRANGRDTMPQCVLKDTSQEWSSGYSAEINSTSTESG